MIELQFKFEGFNVFIQGLPFTHGAIQVNEQTDSDLLKINKDKDVRAFVSYSDSRTTTKVGIMTWIGTVLVERNLVSGESAVITFDPWKVIGDYADEINNITTEFAAMNRYVTAVLAQDKNFSIGGNQKCFLESQ